VRTTPSNITSLKENEIFIFGANLRGNHGKGAAYTAMKFGAELLNPKGPQGRTYAIPTKDKQIKHGLPLDEIQIYVDEFIEYAKEHPELTFLVTEIGCNLAGHTPKDIAPLFKNAIEVENIHLPNRFWLILKPKIMVVNKHHGASNTDFYIGRGSPLGNPFTSIKDRETKAEFVVDSREESIARYKDWLLDKVEKKDTIVCNELNNIYLRAKKEEGVNLVCFCAPKPCHGDVIKELIESKL